MQSVACDKLQNCNFPIESMHDLNWVATRMFTRLLNLPINLLFDEELPALCGTFQKFKIEDSVHFFKI